MSCVVPQHHMMPYLLAVIKTHMAQDQDYKVGEGGRDLVSGVGGGGGVLVEGAEPVGQRAALGVPGGCDWDPPDSAVL